MTAEVFYEAILVLFSIFGVFISLALLSIAIDISNFKKQVYHYFRKMEIKENYLGRI